MLNANVQLYGSVNSAVVIIIVQMKNVGINFMQKGKRKGINGTRMKVLKKIDEWLVQRELRKSNKSGDNKVSSEELQKLRAIRKAKREKQKIRAEEEKVGAVTEAKMILSGSVLS